MNFNHKLLERFGISSINKEYLDFNYPIPQRYYFYAKNMKMKYVMVEMHKHVFYDIVEIDKYDLYDGGVIMLKNINKS